MTVDDEFHFPPPASCDDAELPSRMSQVVTDASERPAQQVRPSLASRVRHAGSWTLVGQVSGQVVRLLSNVVLARLLSPDSFGLMSVVYMLTVALAMFSDLGIGRSVVQSQRGRDADFLDTAWTLGVLRGGAMSLLTVLIAFGLWLANRFDYAPVDTVYADSRLPWIVVAFAVNVAVNSLESIRISQAHRDVQLQRLTKIDLGTQVAAAVLMILIAWLTHSVWALVFGALFSSALRVALSFLVLTGHRVRARLERSALRELIGNGRWIFISSILGFMAANGDRVLLSGLIEAHSFGLYAIAVLLTSAVQTIAFTLSISLAYPALSEVYRERQEALPRTLGNFLWLFDALVISVSGLLVVAGPAFVHVLYDDRYQEAGWILSVLAIGLMGIRGQLIEQVYQAMDRPELITLANFIRLVALVAGIWVGHYVWGFKGVVFGVALSPFAAWPLAVAFMIKHKLFTWRAHALLLPSLAAGVLLGWATKSAIFSVLPAGHAALKSLLH